MRPVSRHYRCTVCRDQRGGSRAATGAARCRRPAPRHGRRRCRGDARDAARPVPGDPRRREPARRAARPAHRPPARRPRRDHRTDRGRPACRTRPRRPPPRASSTRSCPPAGSATGRAGPRALRVSSGHVRPPTGTQFRERNPWLAFEDAFRLVRGFIQRLEGGTSGPDPGPSRRGPAQPRGGDRDDGRRPVRAARPARPSATIPTRTGGPHRRRGSASSSASRRMRPSLERIAAAYHATAWALGREATTLLPIEALAGRLAAAAVELAGDGARARRSTRSSRVMARDGRVVQLVDGSVESTVAVVLGAATAGYRLLGARLADADDPAAAVVELLHPRGRLPPGARTRGNVGLEPVPGGAGDPDVVPSRGLFAPPERVDGRPFSAADAARTVTEAAVETLQARGEPARFERLLGEILVGLDRAGRPAPDDRRAADRDRGWRRGARSLPPTRCGATTDRRAADTGRGERDPARPSRGRRATRGRQRRAGADRDGPPDPVERPARPHPRRARPSDPAAADRDRARPLVAGRPGRHRRGAVPLADRVEWSVFSLLSTAGPIVGDRLLRPDRRVVQRPRRCPTTASSGPASTAIGAWPARPSGSSPATTCCAGARSTPSCWRRIAERRSPARDAGLDRPPRADAGATGSGSLGDLLERRASDRPRSGRSARRPTTSPRSMPSGTSAARSAFLFEVEWTAMLGEPLLRRHARIPPDDALIRFLVIAPERTELVRYKLERSPLLRAAHRRRAPGTSSSRTTCGRSWPATRSTWPTSSRTSGSTRPIERERRADAAVRRLTSGVRRRPALGYASTLGTTSARRGSRATQETPRDHRPIPS